MKILITGGSGFIGTNLVDDLLGMGHSIVIYDKKRSLKYPDLCKVADIRDLQPLINAMRDVDAIYHLAAEHADNVNPVSLYYDVNVEGTKNLVRAASISNVKKIFFTSTVALYGLNVGIPDEAFYPKPFNDYGSSKYQAESVLREWAVAEPNRSLFIIRLVVTFGENNRGNVYNLIKQISSRYFIMVGNGSNIKSMAYVRNVSSFLSYLLSLQDGVQLYNYADKPDITVSQLVQIVYKALGLHKRPIKIPFFIGLLGGIFFDILSIITKKKFPISSVRIRKFCANTQVACERVKETGFVAPYSMEEGLKRMIQYEFLSEPR